jgi:hypothetical protein
LEAAYELRPEAIEDQLLPEAKALQKYLQRHKEHLSKTLRPRQLKQIGWLIRFWEKHFDHDHLLSLKKEILPDRHHPFSAWLLQKVKEQITT